MSSKSPAIHPGEILKEEFMVPLGISSYKLAKSINVPINRISEILAGNRAITADTAVRLGLYFNVDPQWWLNMQSSYELDMAQDSYESLKSQVIPYQAA